MTREGWHKTAELVTSLSPMQKKIVALLAEGYNAKNIAILLGRKRPTISNQLSHACRKTGANGQAHLVSLAYQSGELPITYFDELVRLFG